MTQAIHLRLPDDLRDAVVRLAETEDRTILDMVRRLIKEGLASRIPREDIRSPCEQDAYIEGIAMRRGEKR